MSENITTKENESVSKAGVIVSSDVASKESFIEAIHAALRTGRFSEATRLSQEAAKCYPEDAEMQKYGRILAPPKVISYKLPPNNTVEADNAWLKENYDKYRGKCVALRNGELLGVEDTLRDLVAKVGKSKDILLTRLV
jgi:hypothetical protein